MKENAANRKKNIVLQLSAILFILTLITTYCTSGLLARYISTGEGDDAARVAVFQVKTTDIPITRDVVAYAYPGDTQGYDLVISNKSEVAVQYSITVNNKTGNLPLQFDLVNAAGVPETVKAGTGVGETVFTAKQTPGEHLDKYRLKIDWAVDENEPDANLEYMGMVDYITLTVTAVQID